MLTGSISFSCLPYSPPLYLQLPPSLTSLFQVTSAEGRRLAMQQHQKQLGRALERNQNTYLSKVDSQQCYFETSSLTGEGVEDLFRYIQKTLLAQLQKQAAPGEGKAKKGNKGAKPTDSSFRLDESDQPPPNQGRKCCGQ